MVPGKLDIRQHPFPIEWVAQIDELNGPEGRNVFGWGPEAKRSEALRREVEASRRIVSALRCTTCGTLELRATAADAPEE